MFILEGLGLTFDRKQFDACVVYIFWLFLNWNFWAFGNIGSCDHGNLVHSKDSIRSFIESIFLFLWFFFRWYSLKIILNLVWCVFILDAQNHPFEVQFTFASYKMVSLDGKILLYLHSYFESKIYFKVIHNFQTCFNVDVSSLHFPCFNLMLLFLKHFNCRSIIIKNLIKLYFAKRSFIVSTVIKSS